MFENVKDFYPTPEPLINKLTDGLNFNLIQSVLEPSAGDGRICDNIANRLKSTLSYSYSNKDFKYMIDTIEINNNLRAILKDKGYKVICDDFLKFHTYKSYSLYIANVPFSEGDKHVLKLIQLAEQNNGGHIRCICNAETIKNPYSNTRKLLLQKLDEHNANIEYDEQYYKYLDDLEKEETAAYILEDKDVPGEVVSVPVLRKRIGRMKEKCF